MCLLPTLFIQYWSSIILNNIVKPESGVTMPNNIFHNIEQCGQLTNVFINIVKSCSFCPVRLYACSSLILSQQQVDLKPFVHKLGNNTVRTKLQQHSVYIKKVYSSYVQWG